VLVETALAEVWFLSVDKRSRNTENNAEIRQNQEQQVKDHGKRSIHHQEFLPVTLDDQQYQVHQTHTWDDTKVTDEERVQTIHPDMLSHLQIVFNLETRGLNTLIVFITALYSQVHVLLDREEVTCHEVLDITMDFLESHETLEVVRLTFDLRHCCSVRDID